MDWFYAQNNRQIGPVALEALAALIQRREVQPHDLVWREGMADWKPAAAIPELAVPISAAQGQVNYFNPNIQSQEAPVFAGFWLRFAAFVIDYFLLMFLNYVVAGALSLQMPVLFRHARSPFAMVFFMGGESFALNTAIGWLYYALMESSRYQATLGKVALGLAVTDLSGNRITFGRATGRYFAKFLSYVLYIGFIMIGVTEKKQGLHDIIAGTFVIRKRQGA